MDLIEAINTLKTQFDRIQESPANKYKLKELKSLLRDLEELNGQLLKETNEKKQQQLFKQIKNLVNEMRLKIRFVVDFNTRINDAKDKKITVSQAKVKDKIILGGKKYFISNIEVSDNLYFLYDGDYLILSGVPADYELLKENK